MSEKTVDPEIYSRRYYLTDNEGCDEFREGLDLSIHPKFRKALDIAGLEKGETALDIGCGRGELVYYCAQKGVKSLGIDYSRSAIEIAEEAIMKLPEHARKIAYVDVGDIVTYNFKSKFDVIFMVEILEHMYEWQLKETFKKINSLLTDSGRLIMLTPNYNYEKYLQPLKNTLNIPYNFIKWPFRILRGKYKPKSFKEFLSKVFRIKVDRGQLNRDMHVNVMTPARIKALLSDFEADIKCVDHSPNILSVLTRKWWGRDIVCVARKKKLS